MILSNTKERTRFFRFAIVGAAGAVVDFGVFNLLTLAASFPAVIASIISFITAVASNFTWNRLWTYPDSRSKTISKQMLQFIAVSAIGLAIRTPLFAWLEKQLVYMSARVLPLNSSATIIVAHNLSLAITIGVVMLWNYFANRYWTYSDVV